MNALSFYQKLNGRKTVTTREAAHLSGVSVPAASVALRRLAAKGMALRLKRGNWAVGTGEVPPGALVTAAAEPYQAYLSGWSALRLHGRIQQIPQMEFAVTQGRPDGNKLGNGRVSLHYIKPEVFGGYVYDPRAQGFVASPEKAVFDLVYLSATNRSRVKGHLPETDLKGLRWSKVHGWTRRINSPRIRAAVRSGMATLRQKHPVAETA